MSKMKWNVFLKWLLVALNSDTTYALGAFGWQLNDSYKKRLLKNPNNKSYEKAINAGDFNTFAFDCVCLPKAILWGWNANSKHNYGGAVYKANGVPDIDSDAMTSEKHMTEYSTDFSKIKKGAFVGMKGHMGVYVGNGEVIECTPKWTGDVLKSKLTDRKWLRWGMSKYIDYSELEEEDSNTDISKIDIGDTITIQGTLFSSSVAAKASNTVHAKTKVKVDALARGKRNPIHVTGNGATGWASPDNIVGADIPSFKSYKVFLKKGTKLYDDKFKEYSLPISRERTVEIIAEKNGYGRFNDTSLKGTNHAWIKLMSDQPKPQPKPLGVGDTVKIKKGSKYQGAAKGKPVTTYALSKTCTIDKIDKGNARLQPINSWVALNDLVRV